MLKYAIAGLLACTAVTSAASAATILAGTGTGLDEMIFSAGSQSPSNTIYGTTKLTDTGITFYSSTSTLTVNGSGYAQLKDADTSTTPWKTLEVFLTDGGGFSAFEFTAQFSSKVTPSQLTIGYDLVGGGSTVWLAPLNYPNAQAQDWKLVAGSGETFSRIYFSANDPIFQIKQNDINLASIPGVPEPATWMTMIAGFGLVGVSLRRSRRTVTATLA